MTWFVRIALVVFMALAVSPPTRSVAQQTGVAVSIHQGTCAAVGEAVAPLNAAARATGELRGNADSLATVTSFTTIPISLASLTENDHAIVVPFPVGEELVACGDIGGALTETGGLTVGIAPPGEVPIFGIAYLSPGADPAQTNVSLFLSGSDLDAFLSSTFRSADAADEDVARLAAALAGRDSAERLAGPREGILAERGGEAAGVTTESFLATVTFVNPATQAETTPWDIGFVFHQNAAQTVGQAVTVSSDGSWYHQDGVTGALQVGPQTAFDATPGATNTLDLLVEDQHALFGINDVFVGRIDLPAPVASDVFVTTGFLADHIVPGRDMVYTDFTVWDVPASSASGATPPETADADAALFASALAVRNETRSIAGPFGGKLAQAEGVLGAIPAGVIATDFSATVTFVNPTDASGTPWDYGLAFHQSADGSAIQEVFIDASGTWSYTDFPNGVQRSGLAPTFDAMPGGMNTLDLIVHGQTALFGVNGEFLAQFELPPAAASDVLAATDFMAGNVVAGRELIYSGFEVWEAPDLATLTTTSPAPEDDAARFAAALSARTTTSRDAGPFTDTLVQEQDAPATFGSPKAPSSFSVRATFTNPAAQTETPWDLGFVFGRSSEAPAHAIYVDSEGFWYFNATRAGYVPGFDPTAGAENTLDLIVTGESALFGVNEEFVGSLDLPSTGAGLWVVSGMQPTHSVVGREISFHDFEVWQ